MPGPIDILSGLRGRAQNTIARNAIALQGGRPMSLEDRAKRAWDFAAKLNLGKRIAGEEFERSKAEAAAHGDMDPHNDQYDAMRHARWSHRMANEIDPIFALGAGAEHELENLGDSFRRHRRLAGPYDLHKGLTPGQTVDEIGMDMHNNLEGLKAALSGQAIDPTRLKTFPTQPRNAPLYRSPPPGLEGLPRR